MDTESIILTICLLGSVLLAFTVIALFFHERCAINCINFENGDPRRKLESSNVFDVELSAHSIDSSTILKNSQDTFPTSNSSQLLSKVQPATSTNDNTSNLNNNQNISSSSDIEVSSSSANISENDSRQDIGLTIDQEV